MKEIQCVSCEKYKPEDEFSYGTIHNINIGGTVPIICVQCILEGIEKQRIIDELNPAFPADTVMSKFRKLCPHCGEPF